MDRKKNSRALRDVIKLFKKYGSPINSMLNTQIEHWWDKYKRNKQIANTSNYNATELLPVIQDIDSVSPNESEYEIPTEEMKVLLSPMIASAIQDGIIAKSGEGLLKCINIPANQLAGWKGQDGVLHGYSMAEGKFKTQGQFVQGQFPTPLVAFQVASFVTGMYFQNMISDQLAIINHKLDMIIDYQFIKDRAKLEAIHQWLKDHNNLDFEDRFLGQLDSMLKEVYELRQAYRLQFNKVNINANYTVGSNKHELELWERSITDSRIFDILNIAFVAEVEYLLVNIMLCKMYSMQSPDKNRKFIENCYKHHDPNFYLSYAEKYHQIKYKLETNLNKLSVDAEWDEEGCKELVERVFTNFEHIEKQFGSMGDFIPVQYLKIKDAECIGVCNVGPKA